ncbi:hypothetical protein [Phormidium tenue]|uniref:ATPase involved in DNA repair n=1 Tax=Phormidium tenue NIES-30 TaxID=549789 RepID=A0A1U7J8E6_9CYAN|nr:hypothetical protein [Phormidium tenue]MBD2231332.1 hypothetical protein [Phormidium tenue FACHB-1052]OKH49568.1 hypothetical protein NIES30_06935 [Phormidium tenue NIES-30]
MPRQKRSSPVLEKGVRRAAALKSISASLNLGDGLTLDNYQLELDKLQSQLATYNESLSFVDRALSVVRDTEKEMRVLSERMLIAVAAKYGKDSYEYEMAGGIRKSDRKRPTRKVDIVA